MTSEAPAVRVMRQSFYRPSERRRSATWTEYTPPLPCAGVARPSLLDVDERPAEDPTDVRQEVCLAWPGCVIALEDGISQPWVTFRRSGDACDFHVRRAVGAGESEGDHAFFIFDPWQASAKVEVASADLGLPGVLMTSVFVGNQVDVTRLALGSPSWSVDLGKIHERQVWIHGTPWLDAMRTLESPEEVDALSRAMRLAAELRVRVRYLAGDVSAPAEDARRAVACDWACVEAADLLRRLLEPFALSAGCTELFARTQEMYAQELAAHRRRRDTLPWRPRT